MSKISLIFIFPFVLLAALLWAVVGVFFWIPLLAKSVTIFLFSVLAHAVVDRPVAGGAMHLDKAIRYYADGFGIIFRSLRVEQVKHDPASELKTEDSIGLFEAIFSNLALIFRAFAFSATFWFTLFLSLHHFGLVEIELFDRWQTAIFPKSN